MNIRLMTYQQMLDEIYPVLYQKYMNGINSGNRIDPTEGFHYFSLKDIQKEWGVRNWKQGHLFLCAFDTDEIIGIRRFSIDNDKKANINRYSPIPVKGDVYHSHYIDVREDRRGQGIATKLYDAFLTMVMKPGDVLQTVSGRSLYSEQGLKLNRHWLSNPKIHVMETPADYNPDMLNVYAFIRKDELINRVANRWIPRMIPNW